jgi:hypothetical protein
VLASFFNALDGGGSTEALQRELYCSGEGNAPWEWNNSKFHPWGRAGLAFDGRKLGVLKEGSSLLVDSSKLNSNGFSPVWLLVYRCTFQRVLIFWSIAQNLLSMNAWLPSNQQRELMVTVPGLGFLRCNIPLPFMSLHFTSLHLHGYHSHSAIATLPRSPFYLVPSPLQHRISGPSVGQFPFLLSFLSG